MKTPFFIFPITANDQAELLTRWANLAQAIEQSDDLANLMQQTLAHHDPTALYALTIVGGDKPALIKQLNRAKTGLEKAFAQTGEWKSPLGSYFTANPLGRTGKVAFVYPGAMNAYVGLGQDLFTMFPQVRQRFSEIVPDVAQAIREPLLHPTNYSLLNKAELQALEAELLADPLAMLEVGTSFSILYTLLLRDYFGVEPQLAFGYSLGENSMLWALEAWDDGATAIQRNQALVGRLTRPNWHSYVLSADYDQVSQALQTIRHSTEVADKAETQVYLTLINTPTEIAIAGDSVACQRIINQLQCPAVRTPLDLVIHCSAIQPEYTNFVQMYTLPTQPVLPIQFYTAATYQPMLLQSNTVAQNIATMLCNQLDFPRLLNQVYEDGARLFIELGAGRTCTRWIGDNLGSREHTAIAINKKNTPDHISIMRLLARLISHRVPVATERISELVRPAFKRFDDEQDINQTISELGQNPSQQQGKPSMSADLPFLNHSQKGGKSSSSPTQDRTEQRSEGAQRSDPLSPNTPLNTLITPNVHLEDTTDTLKPHFDKIATNRALHAKNHITFLSQRQAVLQEMGTLIEQQMSALNQPISTAPKTLSEQQLQAFATGRIADCFGSAYTIYDQQRGPRIPNGKLQLITRVVNIQADHGLFTPGSWLHGECDLRIVEDLFNPNHISPRHWGRFWLPYYLYMEIALQACGVLSVYLGATLTYPHEDWYCRNLDGTAQVLKNINPTPQTITSEATLRSLTITPGIIIEKYDYRLFDEQGVCIFAGQTTFGYFNAKSLANQVGFEPEPFYQPGQLAQLKELTEPLVLVDGGKYQQGYIAVNLPIDAQAWFFDCHFYQDPVMPGSLGIEAILEAMQQLALTQKLDRLLTKPKFQHSLEQPLTWHYRGQIIPQTQQLLLDVHLSHVETTPQRITLTGSASLWKESANASEGMMRIYTINNISLCLEETDEKV